MVEWKAVSKTTTWGTSPRSSIAARTPVIQGGLCRGAKGLSFSNSVRISSVTWVGLVGLLFQASAHARMPSIANPPFMQGKGMTSALLNIFPVAGMQPPGGEGKRGKQRAHEPTCPFAGLPPGFGHPLHEVGDVGKRFVVCGG